MSAPLGRSLVAESEAIGAYLNGLLDAEPGLAPRLPVDTSQGWRRFSIGRLWLALPRQRVLAVIHPPHVLRPLPDAPPEVLGSTEWGQRRALVLDPAVAVLADESRQEGLFWHGLLVVLDGGWVALACEAEGEEWLVTPPDARLRDGGGARPWLAGVHAGSETVFIHPDGLTAGIHSRRGTTS
ncbi:MAG: hypothetical protein AB1344_02365 [Pseudomonadota bacterium]